VLLDVKKLDNRGGVPCKGDVHKPLQKCPKDFQKQLGIIRKMKIYVKAAGLGGKTYD